MRVARLLVLLLLATAATADARVLSYAPVTQEWSWPAIQHRASRRFVLVEGGEIVVHDRRGVETPRVIFPGPRQSVGNLFAVASYANTNGSLTILIGGVLSLDSTAARPQFIISVDSGSSWRPVRVPVSGAITIPNGTFRFDVGGPFTRGQGMQLRLGTAEFPFVLAVGGDASDVIEIHAISAAGQSRRLTWLRNGYRAGLAGSSRDGSRFLVTGRVIGANGPAPEALYVLDLNGELKLIDLLPNGNPGLEGWITSDGSVYVDSLAFGGPHALQLYRGGPAQTVAGLLPGASSLQLNFFAVPTHDFEGAWIVQRGEGLPTVLSRHDARSGRLEQLWSDPSAPELEALHSDPTGSKLLLQVHRSRPELDQRLFLDPALAVWKVGDAPPADYHELYLNEGAMHGFVSLDVGGLEKGEPFVFDAGSGNFAQGGGGGVSSGGGGGGDVAQEWGIVRGSLRQILVLPGVSRTAGAFGSVWRTDLVLRNPSTGVVNLTLRYSPNDVLQSELTRNIRLAGNETVHVRDVLQKLFGVEEGGGTLFLEPEEDESLDAVGRTYSLTANGSFGMGIAAIDADAAASPRFPFTFAGSLLGPEYRSNLLLVNPFDAPSVSYARARAIDSEDLGVLPRRGAQVNGIHAITPGLSGSLELRPRNGRVISNVVSIDNHTNDPTLFTPDVSGFGVRVIPVIGHLDGANGSRFRSDVIFYNAGTVTGFSALLAKPWDTDDPEVMRSVSIPPGETRVITDAYFAMFGRGGIGRARVSLDMRSKVRVAVRTYTVDGDGATYGFSAPLVNSFQIIGSDDALDIVGVVGDESSRVNLGLVETSAAGSARFEVTVEVLDARASVAATLKVELKQRGGLQLLDVLRTHGVPAGPVTLRVRTNGGQVTAFATMVDNGTNDPTYLPPRLVAK